MSHSGSHSWPGSAGNGTQVPVPQHNALSSPTAAASFLWSSSGSLDTGPRVGPPTPMGIPRFRALELEGPVLPLDTLDQTSLSLVSYCDMKPVSRHVQGRVSLFYYVC